MKKPSAPSLAQTLAIARRQALDFTKIGLEPHRPAEMREAAKRWLTIALAAGFLEEHAPASDRAWWQGLAKWAERRTSATLDRLVQRPRVLGVARGGRR